ncbi:MAG TPA: ribose-phosphate diphosphokinase [Chloroflexota bacterium]|nr:ribose-phosphate diphosphokinase [Chloroflexota bacterium]
MPIIDEPRTTDRLTIFGGRSHPAFTAAVCAHLGHPVGRARLRTFSDGAIEVKLEENVRGHDVFIIQSGHQAPNDFLMELAFLIDAARRASARSVTAVLPYFPYMKGDKKDEPRVSIRARVVADILEAVGVDRVLTMDLHAAQLQGFFKVPVDNLYGLPVLAQEVEAEVRAGMIEQPVIVAPDAGRASLARAYQRRLAHLGAGVAVGDKVRPELDEKSEVTALLGDVRGRDAVLVDDIVFTGGTLCGMADEVMKAGARSVRAVVSHGLFTGGAVERISASPLREIIFTDTVPLDPRTAEQLGDRLRQVSVASLFAEAIRSVFHQTSISRLFT